MSSFQIPEQARSTGRPTYITPIIVGRAVSAAAGIALSTAGSRLMIASLGADCCTLAVESSASPDETVVGSAAGCPPTTVGVSVLGSAASTLST